MTKTTIRALIVILILLAFVSGTVYFYGRQKVKIANISNFDDCQKNGYVVTDNFPRQCTDYSGKIFYDTVGLSANIAGNIFISLPQTGASVKSPLVIKGQARGPWYFEASFPVKLLDYKGNVIASAPAQAQGEWTTMEFVPFEVTLTWTDKGVSGPATLVLQKDNPSGLPQNSAEIQMPVVITSLQTSLKECRIGGCSGEVCSDERVASSCIYRPEFACYKSAKCERQSTGQCGWTETAELSSCLQNTKKLPIVEPK